MSTAEAVKRKYESQLKAIEGVVGVDYNSSIIIYVQEDTPKIRSFIPTSLEGVPVVVVKTGKIRLLSVPIVSAVYPDRTQRIRPIIGGISIGHPSISAGTFTGVLERHGELVGHTNMHVGCPQWNDTILGDVGDPVLQPGPYDGGTLEDSVGNVVGVKPVSWYNPSNIDSMIFSLSEKAQREIMEIGKPSQSIDPHAGMIVKKSGARSGVTYSKVVGESATVEVDGWGPVLFTDVSVLKPPCAIPGDSGSWVGDENDRTALVIFAGSPYVSLACKARNIEKHWGVNFALSLPYVSTLHALSPVAGIAGGLIKGVMRK